MFRQWSWRCQWISLMMMIAGLVIYNMWVLRLATCSTPTASQPISLYKDPLGHIDLRLGRWDSSRAFKIFDYAAVGKFYPDISGSRNVCLATQSSIDSLHEILKIAAHWSGPISVAVFIAGDEMTSLQAFMTWLDNCQPEFYSRLALHVATPANRPAELGTVADQARNCSQPFLTVQNSSEMDEWRANNLYPQNMLRNLARKNCQTPFVFMVDVDIVPSKGMAESLDKFLRSEPKCVRCAYVIPTYELDWSVPRFPETKSELLQYVRQNLAIPFHKKVFKINQMSSDLNKWEARNENETSETYVTHDVTNYKFLYEPFYVAADDAPPHDERFLGYGFTRNSQVYEMYVIGYQFKVLSPIFTIHWGLQSTKRPKWRLKQQSNNYQKFKKFKKELYIKYDKDPLHFFTMPKAGKTTSVV